MERLRVQLVLTDAFRVLRTDARALLLRGLLVTAVSAPLLWLAARLVYRLDNTVDDGGRLDSVLDIAAFAPMALLLVLTAGALTPFATEALQQRAPEHRAGASGLLAAAGRMLPATVAWLLLTVAAILAVAGFAELGAWLDAQAGLSGWWLLSYLVGFLAAVVVGIRGLLTTFVVAGVAAQSPPGVSAIADAGHLTYGRRVQVAVTLLLAIALAVVPALPVVIGATALGPPLPDGALVTTVVLVSLLIAPLTLAGVWFAVVLAALIDALRRTAAPGPRRAPLIGQHGRLGIVVAGVATFLVLGDWTHDHQTLQIMERDPMASYRPATASGAHRGNRTHRTVHDLSLGLGDEPADLEAYTSQIVEFPRDTSAAQLGAEVEAAATAATVAGWTGSSQADAIPYGGEPRTAIGSWSGTKTIDGVPARISIQASPDTVDFYERDVRQYRQTPTVQISLSSAYDD